MIKVQSVSVSNFLSFKNHCQVNDLKDVNIFIGPNNSGKSNFFRCLKWYQTLLMNESSNNSIQRLLHQNNTNSPVEVVVIFDLKSFSIVGSNPVDIKVQHSLSFENSGKLVKEVFEIFAPSKQPFTYLRKDMRDKPKFEFQSSKNLIEYLFTPHDHSSFSKLDFSHLSSVESHNYNPFIWNEVSGDSRIVLQAVIDFVKRWVFFDSHRFVDSSLDGDIQQMDSKGNNTSRYLESMHSEDPQGTIDAMNELKQIFDLKSINSTLDKVRTNQIETISRDQHNIRSTVSEMGSGFEQVLILGSRMKMSEENCVFFIEEPEIHLHPKAQREILTLIFDNSENKKNQFFVATHSTIFSLVGKPRSKTFLVNKREDFTTINELTTEDLQGLKELLGHKNSDIFGYDSILIVEGDTEEVTIPLLGELVGINLLAEGIGIFNSKSYGNMVHIKNILRMLSSTGTKVFALYDFHEIEQSKLKGVEEVIPLDHRVKLNRSFEDCFETDVLVRSFESLISKQSHINDDAQVPEVVKNLKRELDNPDRQSDASNIVSKYFHILTDRSIYKPEFGIQIAETLKDSILRLNDDQKLEFMDKLLKNAPIGLIKRIHDEGIRKPK